MYQVIFLEVGLKKLGNFLDDDTQAKYQSHDHVKYMVRISYPYSSADAT